VSTVNKDRPSANALAGELGQAVKHGDPAEVIAAYRAELQVRRAERALEKALAAAPPLTPSQVANLRAVLAAYDPEERSDGQ